VTFARFSRRRRAKGVTEAMHGPDEPGLTGVIAERLPDFTHQIGEIFFDDERAGPEAILQIAFGECLWAAVDQDGKQVKRLRRQRHGRVCAPQLARVEVEHEIAEGPARHALAHYSSPRGARSCRNPADPPPRACDFSEQPGYFVAQHFFSHDTCPFRPDTRRSI
jgi:hypothetical protein